MELVLWLDASCIVVRSPGAIFKQIEERGYLIFRNTQAKLGEWASDAALERLGLSRESAMALPEINAAALGLNLRCRQALDFLDGWYEEALRRVSFRGIDAPLRSRSDYQDIKWNRSGRVSTDPRPRPPA
jgi:hypothetical protein